MIDKPDNALMPAKGESASARARMRLSWMNALMVAAMLIFMPLYTHANAADYSIEQKNGSYFLKQCEQNKCVSKEIITEEAVDLDGDMKISAVMLRDLDEDGIPEIIVTLRFAYPYFVIDPARIYSLAKDGSLENVSDGELTNIGFHGRRIISSGRSGPSWETSVYIYENRKLIPQYFHKVVSDTFSTISVYDKNGEIVKEFLSANTDGRLLWEREELSARVMVAKAWLYNTPDMNDKSKMYLVKNDAVVLKKMDSIDDKRWFYLVDYTTKNNRTITKWIEQDAVDYYINAQAEEIAMFAVDPVHSVRVTCDEKNQVVMRLFRKNKEVFSSMITPFASCRNSFSFDGNFIGKKVVIIATDEATFPDTRYYYVIDVKAGKLKYAGLTQFQLLPQDDGTFMYEVPSDFYKERTIIDFADDQIVGKKSTRLFYRGNFYWTGHRYDVCQQYDYDDDDKCEDAIPASVEAPVCTEELYPSPAKIIPLEQCDIKKEEVRNLRRD